MKTYINRAIRQTFLKKLHPNKVLVLLGARRVGKTLFLRNLADNYFNEPFLFLNGEDISTSAVLKERTIANYQRLLGDKKLLIIDEAQKVPDIGLVLKLMVDNIEGIKIIATGSSVFDMTNKLGEPLTGRKYTFHLYPFGQMELSEYENLIQTKANLEERLIYGSYPEVITLESNNEKAAYLNEIVRKKDIID